MKGKDEDADRGGKCILCTSECRVYRSEFPNTLLHNLLSAKCSKFCWGGGEVMAIKYCSNKLGGFQSPFINSVNTTEHLLCTVPDILLV